jgi:acetyl esterase/lipase
MKHCGAWLSELLRAPFTKMSTVFLAAGLLAAAAAVEAGSAQKVLLWPGGVPLVSSDQDTTVPFMSVYLPPPEAANGTAVVVCPGGGYLTLAMDHEGIKVAEWLNSLGVTAFVLKYRVGTWDGRKNKYPIPFMDATRAIRTVRTRAREWGVDPERIGIMGFSAGGHLASTVGTHFDGGNGGSADAVERAGSRPNFMILVYPVISLKTEYVHRGSRKSLLGENADLRLVDSLSNETQVTSMTPPAFLVATDEDDAVPPENSVLFYLALRRAKVPAELHIFRQGRHGFGMTSRDPVIASWVDRCRDWMKGMRLLDKQ